MQCKTIDLISAHKLLQTTAQLRENFDTVIEEAYSIASRWGLPKQFLNKKVKKMKTYFDKIFEGITLSDPKKRFRVTVFFPMMDILSYQLTVINRFEGIQSVVTTQVLQPSFLSSASHLDIEAKAEVLNFFCLVYPLPGKKGII